MLQCLNKNNIHKHYVIYCIPIYNGIKVTFISKLNSCLRKTKFEKILLAYKKRKIYDNKHNAIYDLIYR